MISTSIVSDTPAADWIETEAGWQSGPNLISLIDNCCLKRAMLVADGGLIFIVAEQSLDLPSLSTRTRKQVLSAFAHNLTGDGLLIYISDTRRVTLVRTAHATIPLMCPQKLTGSMSVGIIMPLWRHVVRWCCREANCVASSFMVRNLRRRRSLSA